MLIRKKNKKAVTLLSIITMVLIAGVAALYITTGTSFNSSSVPTETVATIETQSEAAKPEPAQDENYSTPTRLVIPKIGVNTNILEVGLTDSGDMESPQTNEDSGWYKFGTRPGNTGSGVIAGHLGLDGKAVFGKLSQLENGDTLSVIDDKNQTASFVVTHSREYGYDEAPSEVFLSESGAHLNLITCEGDWNDGQNTYSQRLVVFTDRID